MQVLVDPPHMWQQSPEFLWDSFVMQLGYYTFFLSFYFFNLIY